jgi:ubiquinone/menaquinone biosynthesis C-methylase UbiE
MHKTGMTLEDVKQVYSGFEGRLWELIMGEQIHIGGYASSRALGDLAGWKAGDEVVDLCSALGAGMHFLARTYGVKAYGVDATPKMVEESVKRLSAAGFKDLEVKLGDVTSLPYPDSRFDGVWGEDAWCYVEDKAALIAEAARVLRPGGRIAFTDWLIGPSGMDEEAAQRICTTMKFPDMQSIAGYTNLLEKNGFAVQEASDHTEDFANHIENYLGQLAGQRHFDAMQILGWNQDVFAYLGSEFGFMLEKAREGCFGRGRFLAVKEG